MSRVIVPSVQTRFAIPYEGDRKQNGHRGVCDCMHHDSGEMSTLLTGQSKGSHEDLPCGLRGWMVGAGEPYIHRRSKYAGLGEKLCGFHLRVTIVLGVD